MSLGTRLWLAVALPALVVGALGTAAVWRKTELAVRDKTRTDAIDLATFVAATFAATEAVHPDTPPRKAHHVVTDTIQSHWSAMKPLGELRIIGSTGIVRWSRRVEEEDVQLPGAGRLLDAAVGQTNFPDASSLWPLSFSGGGEVIYPLSGASCTGCHGGDATKRLGVLHLTVETTALRREVASVFLDALGYLLFFGLSLTIAMSLAMRYFVSRRVARLAGVMKRAEDGDFVVRAPDMGADEIGGLARSFNRMLARLTELKASEIDNQRDLDRARVELQLKAELEHRVSELQILYDLARTITSTIDLNEVLSRISTVVPTKLNVPKFSLMLLNSEGRLEILKAHPSQAGSPGLTFAMSEGICGRAATTGKAVYVPDLETSPLFHIKGAGGAKGRGSLLSIPMRHGGELLGVLNFEREQKADFFGDEIEFFTAVADQAAMAVQNARLHAQTVALSVTDPLTGIPNRRYLFDQLDSEIQRANRFGTTFSMLMIDIDHFKHLNDMAGHRAGDEVLKEVSSILKSNVRRVDTLARYGGEEFVILLSQVGREEALEVAEKLRRSVQDAPLEHGSLQPTGRVTISIGVATLPSDATDRDLLVDCSDSALYASKRGGRNRVTAYQPGMELEPTRQRGPNAQRKRTGEHPVFKG